MKFKNLEIKTTFKLGGTCRDCHNDLKEVPNGWLSSALFCPKCEAVYEIKLVKVPKEKVTKEYLEQCRKETT